MDSQIKSPPRCCFFFFSLLPGLLAKIIHFHHEGTEKHMEMLLIKASIIARKNSARSSSVLHVPS